MRPQGGNGAQAGPAYEGLRTTKRRSEDLTRRWARSPANFISIVQNMVVYFSCTTSVCFRVSAYIPLDTIVVPARWSQGRGGPRGGGPKEAPRWPEGSPDEAPRRQWRAGRSRLRTNTPLGQWPGEFLFLKLFFLFFLIFMFFVFAFPFQTFASSDGHCLRAARGAQAPSPKPDGDGCTPVGW